MKKTKKITIDSLIELRQKTYLTSAHTFTTFASFFSQNMEMAKEYADKSKNGFDELIKELDELIGDK